jgi:hypothetical protein
MVNDLVPWVKANFAVSGTELHYLVGFSKSGLGGSDLLFKNPTVFTAGAFWDFPADQSLITQNGAGTDVPWGTQANFTNNYQLSSANVAGFKAPFTGSNRIWIGSFAAFQTDVSDYDTLLTTAAIPHTLQAPIERGHRWDTGWLEDAIPVLL